MSRASANRLPHRLARAIDYCYLPRYSRAPRAVSEAWENNAALDMFGERFKNDWTDKLCEGAVRS